MTIVTNFQQDTYSNIRIYVSVWRLYIVMSYIPTFDPQGLKSTFVLLFFHKESFEGDSFLNAFTEG